MVTRVWTVQSIIKDINDVRANKLKNHPYNNQNGKHHQQKVAIFCRNNKWKKMTIKMILNMNSSFIVIDPSTHKKEKKL